MEILKSVSLRDFTTFRIGGRARYFARAFSISDIKEAFNFARRKRIPVFILGGGSNILMSDEGFSGLVIKNEIKGFYKKDEEGENIFVEVGAGEDWDNFVEECATQDLVGVELLSGIPGTVGGAVVQNAGAYGAEVRDTLKWVEVFDPELFLVFKLSNAECLFSYRDSVFKKREGARLIVLKACFKFKKEVEPKISNKEVLQNLHRKGKRFFFFNKKRNPLLVREAVLKIRNSKLPSLLVLGTAGSFFKNPKIKKELRESLTRKYPEMPCFDCGEGEYKLSAGWLIENIGEFKGVKINDAGVWEHHALILANYGEASACDIERLAEIITKSIKNKCGVILEREVVCIGF